MPSSRDVTVSSDQPNPQPAPVQIRQAGVDDAGQVAALHADSWRLH